MYGTDKCAPVRTRYGTSVIPDREAIARDEKEKQQERAEGKRKEKERKMEEREALKKKHAALNPPQCVSTLEKERRPRN